MSLSAWQRTNTFSCGERGRQQRWAHRHIYKEQGMHMLSQPKARQQEEAQGRSAQESSSPENAFDSQHGWRRRRRYLWCCGLSQGEVISSCFQWEFCHGLSWSPLQVYIWLLKKKEKEKKNPNLTTQWEDSIKQSVAKALISLTSYKISAISL